MNEENQQVREWQSVDEAFAACQHAGLNRTKKTIRSWARNEDVEAQKQITPTGERWMLDKNSLEVKIRLELEFQRQYKPEQTGMNPSEPVQTKAEPVRSSADHGERIQTGSLESDANEDHLKSELTTLRSELKSLQVDKAVRDQMIAFLNRRNEEGQTGLLSQSRYIGHLETQVLQLGGKPDQRFLVAPVPEQSPAMETENIDPLQEPLSHVQ